MSKPITAALTTLEISGFSAEATKRLRSLFVSSLQTPSYVSRAEVTPTPYRVGHIESACITLTLPIGIFLKLDAANELSEQSICCKSSMFSRYSSTEDTGFICNKCKQETDYGLEITLGVPNPDDAKNYPDEDGEFDEEAYVKNINDENEKLVYDSVQKRLDVMGIGSFDTFLAASELSILFSRITALKVDAYRLGEVPN